MEIGSILIDGWSKTEMRTEGGCSLPFPMEAEAVLGSSKFLELLILYLALATFTGLTKV